LTGAAAPAAVPPRALLLFALLAIVWGTNWPLFPIVLREISVWTFRAVSMVGAGVVLLAIATARGQPLAVPRRHWGALVAAALLYLVVWNVASAYAAVLLPSGQAAVLGFTMPLWAALIGALVFGERLGARQWLAVALATLGVVLLMRGSFAAYADAPLGLLLRLSAAIGWSIGTLVLGLSRIAVTAAVLTGWQLLIAALPITACAVVFGDGRWFMPSPTTLLLVAYITLVPMAVGNVAWFSIVGLLPANIAGLSSIMVPVVAMISGALVHREPLGPWQWAAMAACAGALAIIVWRPRTAAR
jgi:drug/metabolite transporter (DMT)-like permease